MSDQKDKPKKKRGNPNMYKGCEAQKGAGRPANSKNRQATLSQMDKALTSHFHGDLSEARRLMGSMTNPDRKLTAILKLLDHGVTIKKLILDEKRDKRNAAKHEQDLKKSKEEFKRDFNVEDDEKEAPVGAPLMTFDSPTDRH